MALATCTATGVERHRPLPADGLVPHPLFTSTHAITTDAPPEHVWRWLAQMGAGRAGWYSWDAIDNGGTPSATRVVPELQAVVSAMYAGRAGFKETHLSSPGRIRRAISS